MYKIMVAACLACLVTLAAAAEKSGVFVADEVTSAGGQPLVLNGVGLREKFWVDVYVGSLYLPARSDDVAEILSRAGPWRVQLDFIYKEVSRDKLLEGWREGFENNQSAEMLTQLGERIERFYGFFDSGVTAKEQFAFEYVPGQGVLVTRNGTALGTIEGEDFKTALLEIWLGNKPADKKLKRGMLGF